MGALDVFEGCCNSARAMPPLAGLAGCAWAACAHWPLGGSDPVLVILLGDARALAQEKHILWVQQQLGSLLARNVQVAIMLPQMPSQANQRCRAVIWLG